MKQRHRKRGPVSTLALSSLSFVEPYSVLLHLSSDHLLNHKQAGSLILRMSRKREPPVAGLHPSLLQRSRPNGSRIVPSPDSAEALPLSCCLSNVCRRPPPRSRLPVRVAVSTPRQVKAAQEAERSGAGALVLALTGVAHLSSRTGGSYPLLSAGEAASTCCPCRSACWSR